jgi:hypothetical protein
MLKPLATVDHHLGLQHDQVIAFSTRAMAQWVQ